MQAFLPPARIEIVTVTSNAVCLLMDNMYTKKARIVLYYTKRVGYRAHRALSMIVTDKYRISCNGLAILLLAAMLLGCGKETGYTHVDFSNPRIVAAPDMSKENAEELKVAVAAMVSPKETLKSYKSLLDYLSAKLDIQVRLIQRKSYREINELFEKDQVDLAFICTGPYVALRHRLGIEGLATPVVRGRPFYQSYLIVNQESPFQTLEDLRNHRFAFTDPDSNTGSLVPRYWLAMIGQKPSTFFSNQIYTYSHDNSIMAVARALVDGAAVDGHQWEFFNLHNPQYTRQTRVIQKSALFGSPPLVASIALAPEMKDAIRKSVLAMHQEPEGKRILDQLLIDRFEPPQEQWYQPVREMYLKVHSKHAETTENMAPHP